MKCTVRDLTIHYEALGEGRPLVLLHGWSLDHRHMVSQMEPVFAGRAGWQRIYPDLPGHGRTPAPSWISDQDGMLEALLAFIDCLLPGQRFALVACLLARTWLAVCCTIGPP